MSKYDEIMDKIVVTPKMRERILKNISETDFKKERKTIPFSKIKKYLSVAACFAIIAVGAISMMVWHQNGTEANQGDKEDQIPGMEASYGGVVERDNRAALEQTVGFSIQELENIPFEVTEISYVSYWNEMAEITYYGAEQNIIYRKQAVSNEDISGDYNAYEHEKQITAEDIQVTVKGNGTVENLAIWSDGTYSYSIMATEGMTREEMVRMIESTKGE